MKKLLILSIAVMSASSFANDEANTFTLTESNQGSSFLFEKANDTNVDKQYKLEQKLTPNGVEFYFKLDESTPPTTVTTWYANASLISASSSSAAEICNNMTLGGTVWRSPTVDEVSGAITNYDEAFGMAMSNLGGSNYIARGYINNGSYMYSNFNHKGYADSENGSSLTGTYPTLCVRD